MSLENIPKELKEIPRWVNYAKYWDEKKQGYTKKPLASFKPDKKPETEYFERFKTFEEATNFSQFFGFVFHRVDDICGIDLDYKESLGMNVYEFEDLAKEIINKFDCYTERSPSGVGYHVLFKTSKKLKKEDFEKDFYFKVKKKDIEVEFYFERRFFTVTGDAIPDCPKELKHADDALDWFLDKYLKKEKQPEPELPLYNQTSDYSPELEELLEVAVKFDKSGKFSRLMNGDISDYGDDCSAADGGFTTLLGFYTSDSELIRQALYASRLNEIRQLKSFGNNKKKWERQGYLDNQINSGINKHSDLNRFNWDSYKNGNLSFEDVQKALKKSFKEVSVKKTDYPSFYDLAIEDLNEEPLGFFKTGYSDLDESLGGGVPYRNLMVLAGLQKSGKSSFLMKMMQNILDRGDRIGFINTELPIGEFITNMTAYHFDIPRKEVTTRQKKEWNEKFGNSFEYVGQEMASTSTNDELINCMEKMVEKKVKCIIFDNMTTRAVFSSSGDKGADQLADIMGKISVLTKKSKIASIVVLHLKPSVIVKAEKSKAKDPGTIIKTILTGGLSSYVDEPTTNDVYGGGRVLSQVSGFIFIHRPFQDFYEQPGLQSVTNIIVPSSRGGGPKKLRYSFEGEKGLFKNAKLSVEQIMVGIFNTNKDGVMGS